MERLIKEYGSRIGIEFCGIACTPNSVGSAVVCLFPYFAGMFHGDISIYAQGEDYHRVVRKYLLKLDEYIKGLAGIEYNSKIYCDVSPYSDRSLAVSAGLGIIGKNSCLINKKYGSFVFVGYILNNIEFKHDHPKNESCLNCGKCVNACPGNAIKDGKIDQSKCVSAITQKKGELSNAEKELISKSGYIWGCDICQSVCPHNEDIPITSLDEFKVGLLSSLDAESIKNMSNKEFKKHFANRAFSWRGKDVLLRNININNN